MFDNSSTSAERCVDHHEASSDKTQPLIDSIRFKGRLAYDTAVTMALKQNVVANYIGQGWRMVMSLAFVPLYIKYLSIEAYGLIGVFAMLQSWLVLLDMGMRPALSREMARFTGGAHNNQSIWNLLRSVEFVVIAIAICIAIAIGLISNWLSTTWVNSKTLSDDTVMLSFMLMGSIAALQFVENIYTSSLAGLQKQVIQNVMVTIVSTLRGVGALGVLIWLSPTITAFFMWQALVSVISLGLLARLVYLELSPPEAAPCFSLPSLLKIWRYAAGMMGVTVLSLMLTQVDKLLLVSMLSLEDFGYYTLAGVVAISLHMLMTPITNAFFPRFSELIIKEDVVSLHKAYHMSAQLISVIMGSAAIVLIFFAERVLLVWTADVELTQQVAPILTLLALGTLLNGLMWIPYQMQLASGWTSLAIKVNCVAVFFLIPALVLVVPRFGGIGAAWIWVILNTGYMLIGMHYMYLRLLKTEKSIWFKYDIIYPLMAGIVTATACRLIFSQSYPRFTEFLLMIVISSLVLVSVTVSATLVRQKIVSYMPVELRKKWYVK